MLSSLMMMLAHIQTGSAAMDGFLRPLLSVPYILATLLIGIISIRKHPHKPWLLPLIYSTMLFAGGIIGLFAPAIEPIALYGIAVSVVVLGLILLVVERIPNVVLYGLVGLIGLIHGYAHSQTVTTEYELLILLTFVLGVLVSAVSLQLFGILIGYIVLRRDRSTRILQITGVVFALIGLLYVLSQ